jgi:hypothetical protein
MKQPINEIKRMQKLAGLLAEISEASINDWGKENLVGKKVKFPGGKLKIAYVQWRGDYSSIGHYDEEVNPEEVFTVTKLEKVHWGSRGEKTTAPLLFIKNKSGHELMLSAMDYQPIEVV